MKNKLLLSFVLSTLIFSSFSINAKDADQPPKLSFTFGASYLSNEGFDNLKGTSRTVNNEDDSTHFTVGFNVSPNWAIEAGILTSSEITSRLYSGSSGTLHGKSYSVSQGCSGCATGGSGTLNLKAEIDDSFMFGVKYSTYTNGPIDLYTTLGVLYWDVDYTATGAQFNYNGTAKSGRFLEVDGNDAYMGLGSTFKINNNSSITFEYLVSKIHDSRIRGTSLAFKQSF